MVSINAPLQKGVVTPYGGLVGMEGFEPTQAEPPDLQSGPIHHHWSIPFNFPMYLFDCHPSFLCCTDHSSVLLPQFEPLSLRGLVW